MLSLAYGLSLLAAAPPEPAPTPLAQCQKGDLEKCKSALEDATKRREAALAAGKTALVERIEGEIRAIQGVLSGRAPDTSTSTNPNPGENQRRWEESVDDYRASIRCATAPNAQLQCAESRDSAPRGDSQQHSVGDRFVSEGVAEALTLVADIAVKRAKQQGLATLQARVRASTCALTFEPPAAPAAAEGAPPPERVLPATCSLLSTTTIDKLVGDPRPLQIAIFQDLLSTVAARYLARTLLPADLDALARTKLATLARSALDDLRREASSGDASASAPARARLAELANDGVTPESATPELLAAKVHLVLGVDVSASTSNLVRLSRTALATAVRLVTRKTVTFSTHDDRSLLDLLRSSVGLDPRRRIFWGEARGVPLGLAAADLFLSARNTDRSVVDIVEALSLGVPDLTPDDAAAALEIADLAIIAAASKRGGNPDNPQRVKAAVDLAFRVLVEYFARHGKDATILKDLRALADAALDQDVATAISAGARLLLSELRLPALDAPIGGADLTSALKKRRALEKAVALLTGVAAYADTYAKSAAPAGEPAPDPAQLRQARREALENLIDATTVRTNRHGEWVVSLGIPVGFSGGVQWTREQLTDAAGAPVVNPDGSTPYTFEGHLGAMAPQFSLPMGIAVQRLVGRAYRNGRAYLRKSTYQGDERPKSGVFADGFHLFASVIDLGQFLGYDASGKINRPRWDSFVSPGVQLGWIVGSPANSFLIALDARYAPTLFAGTSKLTVPPDTSPGGAFRVGLTLAYYIPLFDFN